MPVDIDPEQALSNAAERTSRAEELVAEAAHVLDVLMKFDIPRPFDEQRDQVAKAIRLASEALLEASRLLEFSRERERRVHDTLVLFTFGHDDAVEADHEELSVKSVDKLNQSNSILRSLDGTEDKESVSPVALAAQILGSLRREQAGN